MTTTTMTKCCGAYSTYVEGVLSCKKCYRAVPIGEGDGVGSRPTRGIWTPWADVLCYDCHGPSTPRAILNRRDYEEARMEDEEYVGETKCCKCGAAIFLDDKVAAEHNLVLALKADGFVNASMQQTGGMCSAAGLVVQTEGYGIAWDFYANEEEEGKFVVNLSFGDECDHVAPKDLQSVTAEELIAALNEPTGDGGIRAFNGPEVDEAKRWRPTHGMTCAYCGLMGEEVEHCEEVGEPLCVKCTDGLELDPEPKTWKVTWTERIVVTAYVDAVDHEEALRKAQNCEVEIDDREEQLVTDADYDVEEA